MVLQLHERSRHHCLPSFNEYYGTTMVAPCGELSFNKIHGYNWNGLMFVEGLMDATIAVEIPVLQNESTNDNVWVEN